MERVTISLCNLCWKWSSTSITITPADRRVSRASYKKPGVAWSPTARPHVIRIRTLRDTNGELLRHFFGSRSPCLHSEWRWRQQCCVEPLFWCLFKFFMSYISATLSLSVYSLNKTEWNRKRTFFHSIWIFKFSQIFYSIFFPTVFILETHKFAINLLIGAVCSVAI